MLRSATEKWFRGADNPTIHGWRRLLDLGLPFVSDNYFESRD